MKHLLQVLYLCTAPVLDTIDHMDDTFIQRIGQIYSDSLALNFISILLVQSLLLIPACIVDGYAMSSPH